MAVEVSNPEAVTVGEVAEKYIASDLPERFSTRKAYLSNLKNHIVPRWGKTLIQALRPSEIEMWLKSLKLAPKTQTHLRNLLAMLVNSSMRQGYTPLGVNPVTLVRVIGGCKRRKRPRILTMPELVLVLAGITVEPFRTMALLAICLGLRACEVVGLQWGDVDWENRLLHIRRGVVEGRVGEVKTERSEATTPLEPELITVLLAWRRQAIFVEDTDWIFASPALNGRFPYWAKGVQKNHIGPAMIDAGLEKGMGWHTFRHTYKTLLAVAGAPVEVQRDLMRHASIITTFDVYGDSLPEPMRAANGLVAKMVLS